MARRLMREPLERRLIVETNVDVYVFLPKYISLLKPDALYMFCGTSRALLTRLKQRLAQLNPELQILYVENSDWRLPLAPASVDLVIDSFSINDSSLISPAFPLKAMLPYLKTDASVIGNYLFYQPCAKSLAHIRDSFLQAHERTYYPTYLADNLSGLGLELTEQETIGHTTNPGSYLRYHVPHEKLHLLAYTAQYRRQE